MIKKLDNKIFIKIIPYVLCIVLSIALYNNNFHPSGGNYELLLYEALIIGVLLCIKQLIGSLIINILIKDEKTAYVLKILFVILSLSINTTIYFFIILALAKLLKINNNIIVNNSYYVITISIILLSIFTVYKLVILKTDELMRTKNYDTKIKIKVENKKEKPNIYWIHADAMTSIDTTKKYFDYKDNSFREYLENEGFIEIKDAKVEAGHQTITSLPALFNPNYYDNFYYKYLEELEESFATNKKTNIYVNYDELTKHRMYENELINSLKKNKYKIVQIGDYNNYSSLDANYLYDIYGSKFFDKKYRYVNLESKKNIDIMKTIRLRKFYLLMGMITGVYLDDNTFGKSTNDYKINLDKYEYLNKGNYKTGRLIAKSIVDGNKLDNNNKFFFIYFDALHIEWYFDENGEINDIKEVYNLDNYVGNYIYSTHLISDIVSLIKDNDPNSVIIIQADHGIHGVKDNRLEEYLNIEKNEIKNIRNSTISAIYIPEEYKNGEENNLNNPLNITRYLVNNYVGKNYKYIKE